MKNHQPHTEQSRIYVACLAAYNNGILHGAWIEATEAWSMWEATRNMLAKSPIPDAEEWAIHDYEGFASIRINEYDSFERVAELAAFIAEHGALGAELIDHFCGDLEEARSALDDRHLGQYQSLADYVQDITEETTAIPLNLRYYIDWHESNPSGGYVRNIAAALCSAEVARGGKPHADEHEILRAALPPCFLFRGGMQREG